MRAIILNFLGSSIRRKLLLATSFLILVSMSSLLWISVRIQVEQSRESILKSASTLAESSAQGFSLMVQQSMDRARMYLNRSADHSNVQTELEGDSWIAGLRRLQRGRVVFEAVQNGASIPDEGRRVPFGSSEALRYERSTKSPYHRLEFPFRKLEDAEIESVVVYLKKEALVASFDSDGVFERFLFDDQGNLLLSSSMVVGAELVRDGKLPQDLVQVVRGSVATNGQTFLRSQDTSNGYLVSYFKTGVGGTAVAIWTNEERIMDTPRQLARMSLFLGGAILSIALVVMALFSESLTRPLLTLLQVTKEIGKGNFSVRSKPTTRDELADLSQSFNEMASGLEERERIKNVFGKFHSQAILEKLLSEDKIRLGGERMPVTIFFSDIRSFTSSAERMQPEQVVEMLNEYMTEMVSVVERHGGVVDKFIGDAIMAIWGIPADSPDRDAERCLRACLEMRSRLNDLNIRRQMRGLFPIEIGMGVNSGEVVAGYIGSSSRMEYTVIGDAVNTASRIETLTKTFKTDLLLSESTRALLEAGGQFDFVGPFEAVAKGKSGKIQVFGCTGLTEKRVKLPPPPVRSIRQAS